MGRLIPPSDARRILEIYGNNPKRLPQFPPEDFVERLGWRLFLETQDSPTVGAFSNYEGGAFTDWLERETHYEMVRNQGKIGCRWNEERRAFEGSGNITLAYDSASKRVLEGLVACAIEVMYTGGGTDIRRSLERYIPKI